MTAAPVWVNGVLGGRIDPADRGLLLGDGVFDTLVSFGRIPLAGDRHLARLTAHAAAIGIALDPARVREGWNAVIGGAAEEHIILRTTVTRGITARGLWPKAAVAPTPTILVARAEWTEAAVGRPLKLVTSTIVRNAGSPAARLKTIGYLDNILAAREAAEKGADDALLLNAAGKVTCSTVANVFALLGGRLITPPETDGVMAGIVRGLVLELARTDGIETAERSLAIEELFAADEVFLTNSVRLLAPVLSIDSLPLGGRFPDRVTALLQAVTGHLRRSGSAMPAR
jgi:branched-chain amino acid aminotransferase